MKYEKKSLGFTLIEIIVVTAISLTLVGLGVAGYSQFNQTQLLKQTAEDIKSTLRDAQNRALSGEKDNSVAACGSAPSSLPLDHWRFSITGATTYSISGSCKGTTFGLRVYETPNNNITLSPASGTIDFKPLAQGAITGTLSTITLTNALNAKSINITISKSGEIRVGSIY